MNTCTWPSRLTPTARMKTTSNALPATYFWNSPMRLRPSILASVLASLLPLAGLQAADAIQIDTPVGGWRKGDSQGAHFLQQVNYPASSVNSAGDQADTARISGMIKARPKDPSAPARLIVNGISMPLKVQEDGRFDRPFVLDRESGGAGKGGEVGG